eukprot:TRINITY_DN43630_c0_g1_i1.p1 TRINITY_DN43630_c0_g1~~TRINITY_DN43630_c0_g1_i1.p1  ORF type:complete len:357 (-),score=61.75 TRINITY_DN43630_c0_g1_i1:198-1268(-)
MSSAEAVHRDLEQTLTGLEARVQPLEEQANRLKEVAQKLDPVDVRDSAQSLLASAQVLGREISSAKAQCDSVASSSGHSGHASLLVRQAAMLVERISKSTDQTSHLRTVANLKVSRAMETLRVQVSRAVHSHLAAKRKGSDDIFRLADADRDGYVNRDEFFNFLADYSGDAKFSRDQINRLFDFADVLKEGRLDKQDCQCTFRLFYKVSRPKVELYETMGISQGRKVRALDIDEVVELVEGPVKEANNSVRIKCRAMRDGAEGWTVETGNTGTPFLTQAKIHFKVVKSTVLTDEFRLDECKTLRRLEENELLEVRVWEQLEKSSGVKRLKGKANKDGVVGWVTTITNTGVKHLEIV